ncbi:MAG: sterol carrier protein domain-containing protein [Firmicutes bacterium]|nr:sterol carrier protein domain-containing protein [Bacillota bacterium]
MSGEDGKLVIRFEGGSWKNAPEDAEADITVRCMKGDLSSMLMGSVRVGALYRLGLIQADGAKNIDALDLLLYHKQRPFSNNDF